MATSQDMVNAFLNANTPIEAEQLRLERCDVCRATAQEGGARLSACVEAGCGLMEKEAWDAEQTWVGQALQSGLFLEYSPSDEEVAAFNYHLYQHPCAPLGLGRRPDGSLVAAPLLPTLHGAIHGILVRAIARSHGDFLPDVHVGQHTVEELRAMVAKAKAEWRQWATEGPIRQLKARGVTHRQIGEVTQMSQPTIRKMLRRMKAEEDQKS